MCLTFIFKVNHRGQVTDFGFSGIPGLANVRIDTKIKSVACIQPEIRKVIQLIRSRSTIRVTWYSSTYLIFTTSKMLESTPRSTSYHVYNRRWERSCKKVFDLDLQGHAMKIEFFHYHRWIIWPRKPWEIFSEHSDGKTKFQGEGCTPPLGRPKVDFYLGHLRVECIKLN